ncbi:accessory gland peptide Acp33A [Drosophila erecta]|uniref:Uncharacterized protein n=1 Tax=Drosophila erecta TaxID=7220 RepID=B3N4H5_DROER|nr:accessory gland peptide Acp33A [Drosophila erecta]EDV58887.1 uncharacterized protein Dere_GG10305 [Drosophila erecta]
MLSSQRVPFFFTFILILAGLGRYTSGSRLPDCVIYPTCILTKDLCCR